MRTKLLVTALLGVLLLSSLLVPVAADESDDSIAILIDFGNGQVVWADIEATPELNCYNATIAAAAQKGLVVNTTWSGLGAAINWIDGVGDNESTGGWNPQTGEWWGFLLWSEASQRWEYAWDAANDVDADSVTAVAWAYSNGAILPLATPEHRYPWVSFRHDTFNSGLESGLSPNNLTRWWQEDLANGAIDAAIGTANGYLYVVTGGVMGGSWEEYLTDSAVYCLDSEGNIVWTADIGTGYQVASPLIYGDAVIVPSGDGKVYAFYASNGTAKWAPFDTGASQWGVTSSPVAYNGIIIFAANNGKVYALNDDGSLAWELSVASAIYSSSPAVRNEVVYIGSEDGKLHAIASDGSSEEWNITLGTKIRGSPILTDDYVAVTYLTYTGSSATGGGLAAVSYDGQVLWQTSLGITPASAALTSKGFAVMTSTGMSMVGFDGEIIWELDLGTAAAGAAPTAVNGSIFAVTNEANSRLVAVSEYGELYFEEALEPAQWALSAPVVSDGKLYASSDNGNVYAYNLSSIAPAIADFTSTADGLTFTFTATPNEGGLFNYLWDFGDGATAMGRSVNHTYAEGGDYDVALTVLNPQGEYVNTQKAVSAVATSSGEISVWVLTMAAIAIIVVIVVAAFAIRKKK